MAILGAGLGLATAALKKRRGRVDHPVSKQSRTSRNLQVVGLTARVGSATVVANARKVFASAARKETLQHDLELKTASDVAATLGQMKGALMKLGQMASYIDDGLPEPVRAALASLQADAPPMSGSLAASVIEQELGATPDVLFAEWDPVPIAAASIGQVHRAITHDGQAVAVKVQYPGVAEAIRADLANAGLLFGTMARAYPGFDPEPVVAELRERISEELDYRLEATNQQRFADYYADHPLFRVPNVRVDLSSDRVLTTELVAGSTFSEVEQWPQAERDRVAEILYRFVFRSLYRLRSFNGDPHPGNYLFERGGRVTFLDFGLVRRFDETELASFRAMITAMVVDNDPHAFRRAVESAGLLARDAPVTTEEVAQYFSQFYQLVARHGPVTCSPAYASATMRQTFSRSDVTQHTTVPAHFVLIQRINLGLFALLGRLHATADWRRITEELWPWVDGPPSTPLGEAEARWLAGRCQTPLD